MSEIDSYRHECIGIVTCPSDFEIVPGNSAHRNIPLYRLDEDAPDPWRAKRGDLLLGGGSGESPALRIAIPEAIYLFTHGEGSVRESGDDIYQAYWSATRAYVLCNGYIKLGWRPSEEIEAWLVKHVLAFLLQEHQGEYGAYFGAVSLGNDGSICRRPTVEEKEFW